MDAAKAAAVLAVNDISKDELFGLSFKTALPLVAVPTTAGTGSEATPYSVLIDTAGPVKRSVGSPLIFPRFAFLAARYMKGLGRNNTVNTAIDALSHAVEGMCSVRADPISDTLAKESIAMIMSCFDALLDFPEKPEDLPSEIREKLLLASAMAGIVISQTGTQVVHSMGYQFTLNWGTDHGRANGLIMGSFLKLLEAREKAGSSSAKRIPAICSALGMNLDEFSRTLDKFLGKREQASSIQLEEWADNSNEPRKLTNCYITVNREEILEMFRQSVG
jgi:alcohol dehydrogenase class IV